MAEVDSLRALLKEAHDQLRDLGATLNMTRLIMDDPKTRDMAGELVEDAAKVRRKIQEALSDG